MNNTLLKKLLVLLARLKKAKIAYSLAHHRENAIMVLVSVPGERWEIEFLDDGAVEIEKFRSDGGIGSESELEALFQQFTD